MQALSKIRIALNGYKGSRISDLGMMIDFTHTGDLGKIHFDFWFDFFYSDGSFSENFNSLHNKYSPKQYYYG